MRENTWPLHVYHQELLLTSSIGTGAMFSPPLVIINSLERPVMNKNPIIQQSIDKSDRSNIVGVVRGTLDIQWNPSLRGHFTTNDTFIFPNESFYHIGH